METYERIQEEMKNSKKCGKNLWIIKPGENTNRGVGV
jgi:hypothetical protein